MKMTFKHIFLNLKAVCNKYDDLSNERKVEFLTLLSTKSIPIHRSLTEYHDLLLFMAAHPSDAHLLELVESELKRITRVLKNSTKADLARFSGSGLPYTRTVSVYSHDLLKWLLQDSSVSVAIDSFYQSSISLSDALQFTLPSLEKEIAGIGYNNREFLAALKVSKQNQLLFLAAEFDKVQDPFLKDYVFNGLRMYLRLAPVDAAFSRTYNRIAIQKPYFHSENLKQFDQIELLNRKLPKAKKLSNPEFKQVTNTIKNSLTLLQRETDPVTYMDENSFRLYELERGISIAIYGMTVDRQLPLESYVGYTLFKNGFPAAYGGAWVFGKRALFGINIFEPYRGGESGYMMCQLLRVYRQAFAVEYYEVEPYQYGLGNPEGISSGAYWFYYRFGFRSLDPELLQLSTDEFAQIQTQKGYRSSEETLLRFTESNVALQLGKTIPLTVAEVREKVTHLIATHYKGNRLEAEKAVVKSFLQKSGIKKSFNSAEKKVIAETAFLCDVMKLKGPPQLVRQLIAFKATDLYSYQSALVRLLKD